MEKNSETGRRTKGDGLQCYVGRSLRGHGEGGVLSPGGTMWGTKPHGQSGEDHSRRRGQCIHCPQLKVPQTCLRKTKNSVVCGQSSQQGREHQ